jgi:hypothetical protein
LRGHAGIAVDHARLEQASIDLSQVAPTGYYADAVVVLHDHADQPVTGIIVEVQRQVDGDKQLTWPAYVANLRVKLKCAAVLLVVALDPGVAAWARRPIELGHPGFHLLPIVVDADAVPQVHDHAQACRSPELAMLSVLAHRKLEIAEAAIAAIVQLPEEQARLYLDVIMMALPAAIRQILEAQMQRYEYQSDFARKYYGQGREEGQQEGREKGRQEGREEGRQEGLRDAVITLARTKLEELSGDEVAALEAVSDVRMLTELVTSLGRARSAIEARAALDRALGR